MKPSRKELQERALRIPSKDISDDLDCLVTLYKESSVYFDFCVSRFLLLAGNPETIDCIKQIIMREPNQDRYLPLFDVVIPHMCPSDCAEWIAGLLFSAKGQAIAFQTMIQSNLSEFIVPLLNSLFSTIPNNLDQHVLMFRDNLLFHYISTGGSKDLAVKCLVRIPVTFSQVFYDEFVLIASHLLALGGTKADLVKVIMDVVYVLPDAYTLLQLLSAEKVSLDFAKWAKSAYGDRAPAFPNAVPLSLQETSPMLRKVVVAPLPVDMDGPRFCKRFNDTPDILRDEMLKRITKETDPQMLHDYLIANAQYISLDENLPFRYTLLAAVTVRAPAFVPTYLTEFCRVKSTTALDVQIAAARGLEVVAQRNPDAVAKVFAHVRMLLRTCDRKVQIPLMNAIACAVGNDQLEAEFIWRAYRDIRTVPDYDTQSFDGLLHQCIIAMNDKDDREVAIPMVKSLHGRDMRSVVSGLWRFPSDRLPVASLLPRATPSVFVKNDPFPLTVREEFAKKSLTTSEKLQLATAFAVYPQFFEDIKTPWVSILRAAGDAIFNLRYDQGFVEKLVTDMTKSSDDMVRFASVFALDMFMAYRLIPDNRELFGNLLSLVEHDSSSVVRLMAYYGMSMCPMLMSLNQLRSCINGAKETSSKDDLIGIGYCMNSWFPDLIRFLKDEKELKSLPQMPYIWPFIFLLSRFMGEKIGSIKNGDAIGMAQFVYMTRDDDRWDDVRDAFVQNEMTPEIAMTALVGYIPSLAFRITAFEETEKQREILAKCRAPEFDLLRGIITHEREFHRPVGTAVSNKKERTPINKLIDEWETMEMTDIFYLVKSLGDVQIEKLMKDTTKGYSLMVAAIQRSYPDMAAILCAKQWDAAILEKFVDYLGSEYCRIVVECMIEMKPCKWDRIARFMVFAEFGDILADDIAIPLLPSLLADLSVNSSLVKCIEESKPEWIQEFARCLLLKDPEFVRCHEAAFDLFQ